MQPFLFATEPKVNMFKNLLSSSLPYFQDPNPDIFDPLNNTLIAFQKEETLYFYTCATTISCMNNSKFYILKIL